MNRKERNQKSREHILTHAFAEFAVQGYSCASINTICSSGQISKGLMYHYYTDKDALYLACVEKCFRELTEYLAAHLDAETVTPDHYFDVRLVFFRDNPLHQKLFLDTVVSRPAHLDEQISCCRRAFDELNDALLSAILSRETLAEGVSIKDALWQLRLFENLVGISLNAPDTKVLDAEEHTRLCRQSLHVMLYGLISRQAPSASVSASQTQ